MADHAFNDPYYEEEAEYEPIADGALHLHLQPELSEPGAEPPPRAVATSIAAAASRVVPRLRMSSNEASFPSGSHSGSSLNGGVRDGRAATIGSLQGGGGCGSFGGGGGGGGGGGMSARDDRRFSASGAVPAWCDRRPLTSSTGSDRGGGERDRNIGGGAAADKAPQRRWLGSKTSPRGPPAPTNVVRRTSAPANPVVVAKVLSQDERRTSSASASAAMAGGGAAGEGRPAPAMKPVSNRDDVVSLCIRLRPGPPEEMCVNLEGQNGVRLKQPFARSDFDESVYGCDRAFGPAATQEEVYDQAVTPICAAVLQGYNGAVIAYGQTGSGKTHTMIGTSRCKGMAPRAVNELFAALSKRQHWTVEVSVLEIYNERVRDLLAPGSSVVQVDIHEQCAASGLGSTFHCPDATRLRAACPEDALAALAEGMKRRETARTDMNHHSSRSHLVFTLSTIQSDQEIGATLRGRLHIVDLAGSERLKRSMSSDVPGGSVAASPRGGGRTPRDQRREAGEINKSLSQLALVIQRLTGPKASGLNYIPYRDSMLTRLLAESFGGSSKTCLVITCSALARDREETRCSLEFGKRAKLVKNRAEINLEVTQEPTPVMQALVARELAELQREKEELKQEREIFIMERQRLQEQLQGAVADAIAQQRQRASDVQDLEIERAALQRQCSDAVAAAVEMQRAHTAESQRRESVERELRETERRARSTDAALEERVRQVSELREQLHASGQENAKSLSKLDQDSVEMRRQWLDDVSRLSEEKSLLAQTLEEERASSARALESRERQLATLRSQLQNAMEEKVEALKRAEQDGASLRERWHADVAALEAEKALLAQRLATAQERADTLEQQQRMQASPARPTSSAAAAPGSGSGEVAGAAVGGDGDAAEDFALPASPVATPVASGGIPSPPSSPGAYGRACGQIALIRQRLEDAAVAADLRKPRFAALQQEGQELAQKWAHVASFPTLRGGAGTAAREPSPAAEEVPTDLHLSPQASSTAVDCSPSPTESVNSIKCPSSVALDTIDLFGRASSWPPVVECGNA
eukprot:TRINITY_DN2206_c1_g1_i2.p1 TRINITY_DN2206_c1_g1~~TRINITY_DN2206_c1_g1_i2.p1  ORF type:complete len:1065 (-),score=271.91 TRINITY_DN2206_c1_g1_i2:168-3299(-)